MDGLSAAWLPAQDSMRGRRAAARAAARAAHLAVEAAALGVDFGNEAFPASEPVCLV